MATLGVAGAQIPPAVELRVPKPPTLAFNDSGAFLAYEIHVTNFTSSPLLLRRVEVLDGARESTLFVVEDSALLRATIRPGVNVPLAERAQIGGGLRAVVFLWVSVPRENPPTALRHRLAFQTIRRDTTAARADTTTHRISGAAVAVDKSVAVIGPPLRGEWASANGLSNVAGHRRTIIGYNGQLAIGQRFGADFLQMDDEGKTFRGDRTKNSNFLAYGNEILAVADGIVVATKDSIPENDPTRSTNRAVPVTLETVGGNHIVLDVGQGHFAFYAHVQPGSLRVRVGDRVKRGQTLALVGNSGNSTEPHLHFHMVDAVAAGSSTLGAEGIPYLLEEFAVSGRCTLAATIACARGAPTTRKRELPPANTLIRFPR